jgi:hypothetical protein
LLAREEAGLANPKRGHVIYFAQIGGDRAPIIADKDMRTLTLGPRFDGDRVQVGEDGPFQAFKRDTIISKGQYL